MSSDTLEHWMYLDTAKLKALREKRGLTQTQLAKAACLPQSNYSRIESGIRNDPNLLIARRLAKAMGCSLNRLVSK